jgi:GNAT superfamily N-acetyltransferase
MVRPVHEGLLAFNEAAAGARKKREYALLVRDKDGNVSGGLIAVELWGWLYVDTLWLPQHLRGRGLGSQLLRQAEEIAISNECRYSYLSTVEYQARPFYERHGYSVFGALVDFPAGSGFRYFYLRKDLPKRKTVS